MATYDLNEHEAKLTQRMRSQHVNVQQWHVPGILFIMLDTDDEHLREKVHSAISYVFNEARELWKQQEQKS